MRVGVLVERKHDERRVSLRPDQAAALVADGHEVLVESGAGVASGFEDAEYSAAGAALAKREEVYDRAGLLLKVKCPLPEEYGFLRAGRVLFAYLHFDENVAPSEIERIAATGITGIAYEWVEKDGTLPLLAPMSEITGAIFALRAIGLLIEHSGVLGGGYVSGWPASQAMVIGAGRIGSNAINVLLRNRFRLVVVDKHPETIEERVRPYVDPGVWSEALPEVVPFDESDPASSVEEIRRRLPATQIVISAAVRRPSLPKSRCEYLIDRAGVASMPGGSVLCDATACDRDLIETAVSSESLTETYVEAGTVHYNCDHVPSLVPATATKLLTDATFPYVRKLAGGFDVAARSSAPLRGAVMCHRGRLTHTYSAEKKGLPHVSLDELLGGARE